jgi:hypothetical protein
MPCSSEGAHWNWRLPPMVSCVAYSLTLEMWGGDDMFLRNVRISPNCLALHRMRLHSSVTAVRTSNQKTYCNFTKYWRVNRTAFEHRNVITVMLIRCALRAGRKYYWSHFLTRATVKTTWVRIRNHQKACSYSLLLFRHYEIAFLLFLIHSRKTGK